MPLSYAHSRRRGQGVRAKPHPVTQRRCVEEAHHPRWLGRWWPSAPPRRAIGTGPRGGRVSDDDLLAEVAALPERPHPVNQRVGLAGLLELVE